MSRESQRHCPNILLSNTQRSCFGRRLPCNPQRSVTCGPMEDTGEGQNRPPGLPPSKASCRDVLLMRACPVVYSAVVLPRNQSHMGHECSAREGNPGNLMILDAQPDGNISPPPPLFRSSQQSTDALLRSCGHGSGYPRKEGKGVIAIPGYWLPRSERTSSGRHTGKMGSVEMRVHSSLDIVMVVEAAFQAMAMESTHVLVVS